MITDEQKRALCFIIESDFKTSIKLAAAKVGIDYEKAKLIYRAYKKSITQNNIVSTRNRQPQSHLHAKLPRTKPITAPRNTAQLGPCIATNEGIDALLAFDESADDLTLRQQSKQD